MKNWLWTTSVAAIVASGPAFAADLPTTKTPPLAPPAPVFSWTGCYVGGNLGAAWAGKRFTDESDEFGPIGTNVGSATANGLVGGGQVGCDYQFASNWVIGVQAMGDWAGLHGSALIPNNGSDYFKINIDSFATVTDRIGYIVNPTLLFYAKGGVGFVDDKYNTSCTFGFCVNHAESASGTRAGLDLGGGLEYKFAQNWSAFAEYDHVFLGSKNTTFNIAGGAGGGTYVERIAQDLDKILVGVNYRFDTGGAPVSARY